MQSNILKGKMVAAGYNQGTLAEQLNISANALNYKINGKRPFTTDEVIRLCELLHIVNDAEKAHIFLR